MDHVTTDASLQSVKKNRLRSFWDWTCQSWKRKILVGVAALVVLVGISSAASGSHGGTAGTNGPAPGTAKYDYLQANVCPMVAQGDSAVQIANIAFASGHEIPVSDIQSFVDSGGCGAYLPAAGK